MRLRLPAVAAALLLACAPVAAQAAASADTLLYERTLMREAGARCGLFQPRVAAALGAAQAQARGAALRGGTAPGALNALQDRARAKAWSAGCGSPDLKLAAGRVNKAFDGYANLYRMDFPGESAAWRADRYAGERWRLVQTSGGVRFGIIADADGREALALLWPADQARGASAARLVLRDPLRARAPYLDPRRRDLAGRAPPRSITRALFAGSRAPASTALAGAGAQAVLFRFPPAAARALAELDPREAASVELVFPTRKGERVRTALIEVGDFAAGQAFLAAR